MSSVEARLDTPRSFYFLPTTLHLGLAGSLQLYIYNDAGQAITGSPFATTLVTAPAEVNTVGVYKSAAIAFPAAGAYTLVWVCVSPAIKVMEDVTVLVAPLGDFPTSFSRKFRYQTPGSVVASDVVLKVINSAGQKVGSTHTTTVTAQAGVYETTDSFLLADEGVYLFIWTSATGGYSHTRIEQRLVLPSVTRRSVTVVVVDTSTDPENPEAGIDVLVSETDGTPVSQTKTNGSGAAYFLLEDGDYIATARRTGYVYNLNNIEITVAEAESTSDNVFYILAVPFQPTFDATLLFDADDKSLMSVDLADMRGQALCDRKIFISNRMVPDTRVATTGSTFGIFGEPLTLVTNGRGHAEVYLLRGQTVTVAVEGTPLRRTFVVPSQASFSLLDILTNDDDPFDIVQATTSAAEQGV